MEIIYDRQDEEIRDKVHDLEAQKMAEVANGSLEKSESLEELLHVATTIVHEYFEDQGFDPKLNEEDLLKNTHVINDREVHLQGTDHLHVAALALHA